MSLSLWLDGRTGSPRSALPGDRSADIAIVGAGFTGLWTAYYLRQLDPGLRITVIDRHYAGFGASGRNGGWCSDLFPESAATIAREHGVAAALRMRAAMRESVSEVGRRSAEFSPGAAFHRGGTLGFVRSNAQLGRAHAEVAEAARWGDDVRWLDRAELAGITGVAGALGATFTVNCASIDPGALVRDLADEVERSGVTIHEGTTALSLEPGRVRTDHGTISADVVIRAVEGFGARLPGQRRSIAPVYSLVTATEPLDAAQLAAIGLGDRPTFTEHRNMIVYGQRTAAGRLVFGGRGAPYHFGSRISSRFDSEPAVFARLQTSLVDMFPCLAGVRFTHTWGGPLGIARDWHASVGLERTTGMAWAGGYVGDGVATTNLAGRTLADLITGHESELTDLAWVGHRSRQWEPEPLRWLGINGALRVAELADRREVRTGRPSRLANVLDRLTGH